MAVPTGGIRRGSGARDAVDQHARAVARLAMELWAVKVVTLVDVDGRMRCATFAVSDHPEYEQMMLEALPLPNRWASLDLVNAALCDFVHEQHLLLERGGAPILDGGVLAVLSAGDGTDVPDLGVETAVVSVADCRAEMRVALALGPHRADGSRPLTSEFGFVVGGAPQDGGQVLRRQGARLLWYSLGGHSMGGPDVIPDPAAFVGRLQRDQIQIDRRFRSEPEMRRLLTNDA